MVSNTIDYKNSSHGFSFRYVDFIKKNNDYLQNTLRFFIEVCRVTWGGEDACSQIKNLVDNNSSIKDVYHEELLRLNKQGGIGFLKIFESDLFAETEYTDNLLETL